MIPRSSSVILDLDDDGRKYSKGAGLILAIVLVLPIESNDYLTSRLANLDIE